MGTLIMQTFFNIKLIIIIWQNELLHLIILQFRFWIRKNDFFQSYKMIYTLFEIMINIATCLHTSQLNKTAFAIM